MKKFVSATFLLSLLSITVLAQAPARRGLIPAPPAPPVGKAAPEFALKDANGKKHALKDYRGKLVVLSFLSMRCNVTKAYQERIRTLASEAEAHGIAFLGINSNANETISEIRQHASEVKFDFPILKDDENRVADLYGAERTPEMYIIDQQGILRYHGRIDNSIEPRQVKRRDLHETLNELLANKPVSTPETKAFGCIIIRAQQSVNNSTLAGSPKRVAEDITVTKLKPAGFTQLVKQSQGNVLVVNFWATWCGPCVAEFPEFVRLDELYRAKGVKIAAITLDELTDLQSKVIPFLKEH
ncbi:MAG TPA: redoxin domain-containing protein, partial [Blastocatellia bacterium]|nr:redoxin domain-containing protein [Blastocatellia bacterium]